MATTKEVLEFKGRVIEALPNATFLIKLENGSKITAYTSGKMKKNRINVLLGDEVLVEMTPYDLSLGRVVRRVKAEPVQAPQA